MSGVNDAEFDEENFVSLNAVNLDNAFSVSLQKDIDGYFLCVQLEDGSQLKSGSSYNLKYRITNFIGDTYDKQKAVDISFKVVDRTK